MLFDLSGEDAVECKEFFIVIDAGTVDLSVHILRVEGLIANE